MLMIEEYISRRKKEDNLNEFEYDKRSDNIKKCVDYVFEYFNSYLTEYNTDDKTILQQEKTESYRKYLKNYDPLMQEWAVRILNDYGKQITRFIHNLVKEEPYFFLYNKDSEFRCLSYDWYTKLIKKLPFLRGQNEDLFLFIKEYHQVISEERFHPEIITPEIDEWLNDTWVKYHVNILAFAFDWIFKFSDKEEIWPPSHRLKSTDEWREYTYNYKRSDNLFNIDTLYRKMPKKVFTKGKKQEFETLFMYLWINQIEGDSEYWDTYLKNVNSANRIKVY